MNISLLQHEAEAKRTAESRVNVLNRNVDEKTTIASLTPRQKVLAFGSFVCRASFTKLSSKKVPKLAYGDIRTRNKIESGKSKRTVWKGS